MKKKLLSLIFATTMVMALTACGSTKDGSDEPTSEGGTENNSVIEAKADENGNYIVNGSFEEIDFTGWDVVNVDNVTEELDVYTRETDCTEGIQCLHFYSGKTDVNFTAEQKLTGLEDGTYKLKADIQGEAAGDENAEAYFYVVVNGEKSTVDGQLNGYLNWYTAELSGINVSGGDITIGICVKTAPGGWGTIDNITLVKE